MERLKSHIPYLKSLPVILIAVLFYKAVDRLDLVSRYLGEFLHLLIPFVWAGVLAYLLNPLLRLSEGRLRLGRKRSLTLIYLLVVALIYGALTVAAPVLISSTTQLVKEFPTYMEKTQTWVQKEIRIFHLDELAETYGVDLETVPMLQEGKQLEVILKKAQDSLLGLLGTLLGITTGILSFVIGLIISFYILKDKEKFGFGLKRASTAWFGEAKTLQAAQVLKEADKVFSGFIIGKIIDSLIIGVLCYIGLTLLNMPYSLLLTVLVALFNMIPYFGIYLSIIPAGLITLFYSPVQAMWLVVFLLILQKFDAYILGPKILGESVGLPPFWIVVSLLLGGELFGIVGMILAVPTFAVIKRFVDMNIERRLSERNAHSLL